ncbi:sigma-70 family RNA polymerase sigma factor [Pseudoalteromonas sp. MM17-2]|uniref:RNA polymerase sigma factor n=1 Tax=Pseudoalteromonas sp. MM17-2 TaxID=2917753 RepID=UPI001EF41503|nr:sigma-70 family RNA polymerase sigma factor [Pseudoalteromonas sp. MM17-2]MCG7546125.1 sigma-70 family RNA polymerase sigma factor [Pseudoalteromonas sp. MM17-2]
MIKAAAAWFLKPKLQQNEPLSDEQLVHQALKGDAQSKAAKHALISRLSDDLLYFVQAQLGSVIDDTHTRRQLALDMLQEIWLMWLSHPQRYQDQGHGSFKAWLFRVARNRVIDYARRVKVMLDIDTDEIATTLNIDHQQVDRLIADAELAQLSAAMQQLPFHQKEALMLQLEGFSLGEIATITHTAKESVKTRLRYARDKLAIVLQAGAKND